MWSERHGADAALVVMVRVIDEKDTYTARRSVAGVSERCRSYTLFCLVYMLLERGGRKVQSIQWYIQEHI